MFKKIKKSLSLIMILAMVFSFDLIAFAQGTTSITVSTAQIGVGDVITVSVAASTSGTVTVKYTASLLELSDCSVDGYSSDGNAVTFDGTAGDVSFKAIGEGTASVIVSSTTCSGSSTTITIEGQGTGDTSEATETAEATEGETADVTAADTTATVGTLNDAGGFDINGVSYVVSERYSESEIPSGYSKVTLSIGGGTYSELSNGTTTLIYLKPADNTEGSGVFYLYDEASGTVSNFDMLVGTNDTIILASPDSIPSALYQTTATFGDNSYTVYTFDGSEGSYIYGTNSTGITGWFFYDANGTVSRVETALLSMTAAASTEVETVEETTEDEEESTYDATEVYKDKLKKLRRIISALVIICVILLFVLINNAVRGKSDDVDPDDIFAKTPAKPQSRLPRSIVFANPDDDEEEDEDEDSDDDENESKSKKSDIDMMDLNDL